MSAISLAEKILRIEAAMKRARIPHAFGGALALAYCATPRATIDVDVNVFVGTERANAVLDALGSLGVERLREDELAQLLRDGQTRVHWDRTPIDLFFSYDDFHDACFARRRIVPFGDADRIHVLAAEDLVVFKVIFDREKDWRDLDEVLFALGAELDVAWIDGWLERIVGREDARFRRWAAAVANI